MIISDWLTRYACAIESGMATSSPKPVAFRAIAMPAASFAERSAAEAEATDANASRLAKELLAADADEQRLRQRYFGKIVKAIPAKKAARYLQIENKIRAIIKYDIAQGVPLVQ